MYRHLNTKSQPTLDEAFRRIVVDAESGCWDWNSAITTSGHACIKHNGRTIPAHKFVFQIFNGPVPNGMVLDHLCRNRRCANPSHLRVVTRRQNALENSIGPSALNAAKPCCPRCGGPYVWYGGKRPGRMCLRCQAVNRRARRVAAGHSLRGSKYYA